jgi:hypothetical protein
MEDLKLEASKILDKYDIAGAYNQAMFDELLYGTSCIIISDTEIRAVKPYSKEWFKIFKLEQK